MRAPAVSRLLVAVVQLSPLASRGAAQMRDVDGSQDHPIVSRYAGSTVIGYDVREFDEFELPLGPLERQEGGGIQVRPTKSRKVEGRVTRILYVAPAQRSPLEVLRNY